MKIHNYKKEILTVLRNLTETYPNQLLSTHLSLALSDYPKFDGISDKEFYFILEKYRCEKELDMTPITSDEDIDQIYKSAMNLEIDSFDEEDF